MPLNKMAKLTENERNEQSLFGCLQLIYRHVSAMGTIGIAENQVTE
jgi:hypothetical protein